MTKSNGVYTNHFKNNNLVNYYETIEYANNSYYSLMWKLEQAYLLKKVKEFKTNKIKYLDFACGTGRIISFLENYVDKSIGIDVSQEMIDVAKKRILKSKLIRKNITKEPINSKYDLITAFRFFLNAEQSLRMEVIKALRKGMTKKSILIFSIHGNKYSFRYLSYLANLLIGKRLNQLSYSDVYHLLDSNGYEIIDWVGVGFLPKVFYRIPAIRNQVYEIDKFLYDNQLFRYFSPTLIFSARLK